MALLVVDVTIVAGIPLVHGLVQTIKPVGSSGKVDNLLAGNVEWHKLGDGVADEHVGMLDVAPEEAPDVGLGGALDGDEVASDLDVRSVKNGAVRGNLLNQWDEAGHLGIIDLFWCQFIILWRLNICGDATPDSWWRSGGSGVKSNSR